MKTEHVDEHLAAYLSGDLDQVTMHRVTAHVTECPACNTALQALRVTWDRLGELPQEAPRPVLTDRFYDMLRAYEAASAESPMPAIAAHRTGVHENKIHLIIPRYSLQFAFAAAMLVIGFFIGTRYPGARTEGGNMEISELRDEVRGMGRMLTMSLLQQQSASERLRGVSWSEKLDQPDQEVTGSLLRALGHDGNVNVRLAALDALSRQATDENIRREMLRALPQQTSPLVQLAMIDLFIQLQYKPSADIFRTMAGDPNVNETVKLHLQQGIKQLS